MKIIKWTMCLRKLYVLVMVPREIGWGLLKETESPVPETYLEIVCVPTFWRRKTSEIARHLLRILSRRTKLSVD